MSDLDECTISHGDGTATVIAAGVRIECVNLIVARCVSLIADENIPDAMWAAKAMNAAAVAERGA
ncbi:hypothetical protein TSH7_25060 [Azospirillum sp. TSH7]|uniref:hypothetical protein n=1 Tax=unclassified Azospirillum TaxID=2630922 RepID=UPI000D605E56|nr:MULTISPECIES: hypothetical protein [unclassified Azospirillum]PWC57818.1 hypothetical protein TSH7_25060 [Azospirillum sp. TSH7]PWC70237.1 hypothetical protein TSH20_07100 [Azospirillum sp. TSH20]